MHREINNDKEYEKTHDIHIYLDDYEYKQINNLKKALGGQSLTWADFVLYLVYNYLYNKERGKK